MTLTKPLERFRSTARGALIASFFSGWGKSGYLTFLVSRSLSRSDFWKSTRRPSLIYGSSFSFISFCRKVWEICKYSCTCFLVSKRSSFISLGQCLKRDMSFFIIFIKILQIFRFYLDISCHLNIVGYINGCKMSTGSTKGDRQ